MKSPVDHSHKPQDDHLPARPGAEEECPDAKEGLASPNNEDLTEDLIEDLEKTNPAIKLEVDPPEVTTDFGLLTDDWTGGDQGDVARGAGIDATVASYQFDEEKQDVAPSKTTKADGKPQAGPAKPWSLVGHFLSDTTVKNPPAGGLQPFFVEDEPEVEAAPGEIDQAEEPSVEDLPEPSWPTIGSKSEQDRRPAPTHLFKEPGAIEESDADSIGAVGENEGDFIVEEIGESFPDPETPLIPGWDPAAEVVVYCRNHVYQEMYRHALDGVPRADGGELIDGRAAFEVKGVLLGVALIFESRAIVLIVDALRLPISPMDRNDRCSYGPVEDDIVRRYLIAHRGLGVVGYYHSHPDHPIFLSVFDVQTLNRRCVQDWSVAAVVQPRDQEVGFFVKQWLGNSRAFVGNQKPGTYVPLS